MMKRYYFLLLSVMTWMAAIAADDDIVPGTHFFDGQMLYQAEQRYGHICLVAHDDQGKTQELYLKSYDEPGAPGFYDISPRFKTDAAPWGAAWNLPAQYTQLNGSNVIQVFMEGDTSDYVANILVQTPNSLSYCLNQQQWASKQKLADLTGSWLLNHDLLSTWSTDELVAQAQSMAGRELSETETANHRLIRGVIAQRRGTKVTGDPMGVEPFDVDLADLPRYVVHNADEFISSLGPDREIIIENGVEINLSRVLDNYDYFSKPGFKMDKYLVADKYVGDAHGPIVMSEFSSDGSQLSLININNLYIHGRRGAKIVVEPRRAYVFNLVGCSNVWLSNLTMGHTEGGVCEGGVVGASQSSGIHIFDCDLYGCGTYGLDCNNCFSLYMKGSNIHDCTYGIMELKSCVDFAFDGCDFFRNSKFDLVGVYGCEAVLFNDCRFYLNHPSTLFDVNGGEVALDRCVIYHPADEVAKSELVRQVNCWRLDGDEVGPPSRGCGPK